MFDGYWGRPEATVAAFKDLWFHTGDMGMLDENDYFYFVDRKKDYLRRGGENISSFEVETTFLNHPAVAEVAAHSVFSELSEDELKVTIVLRQGAELCEEDLCRWAVGQLPRFAVPRFIEFRSALPRTPTGRIQKFELRADGVTPATWDRQASDIVPEKRA
jgi:crotonobetaine/carnitine-CoA ligase